MSVQFASGVSFIPGKGGEVFVRLHSDTGEVFAVAGLTIHAAVDANEKLSATCHRVLAGQTGGDTLQ
jgi:hypothetical protein